MKSSKKKLDELVAWQHKSEKSISELTERLNKMEKESYNSRIKLNEEIRDLWGKWSEYHYQEGKHAKEESNRKSNMRFIISTNVFYLVANISLASLLIWMGHTVFSSIIGGIAGFIMMWLVLLLNMKLKY
jgi:Flp pilus assembly protein TadB